MKTILKYLGGKKIGWSFMMFVASCVLLGLEQLDSAQWINLVEFLTIVAVGGNVAGMAIHGWSKNKQ